MKKSIGYFICYCVVPLSSPLRFFLSDKVTSVLIIGVSLVRSLEFSELVTDETIGANKKI